MICRSLDYYMLVVCFVVTMPQRCATTDLLPPPFNLSYRWLDPSFPFFINLTWQARPFNPNCSRKYELRGIKGISPHHYKKILVADLNSDANFTLKTTKSSANGPCKHYGDSGTASIVIPRQVPLVTDFKFFLYPRCDGRSSQTPFCGRQATWTPGNWTSRLEVFHRLCYSEAHKPSRCRVFSSGGLRQGCHLTESQHEQTDVCIHFRGTVNGRNESQTFRRIPGDHIRSLPPNVSVSEQGGRLRVSWRHASVCHKEQLNYTLHYRECDRPARPVTSGYGQDQLLVHFDRACRYEIRVQPRMHASCAWPDSSVGSALLVYNDGASRDHSVMVACVAIPSSLSVLVVVVCYYVRRKRMTIFKNIPVPPSSLKEMMSSIHQSQLFVPVREVVDVCSVGPAPAERDTLMWAVP